MHPQVTTCLHSCNIGSFRFSRHIGVKILVATCVLLLLGSNVADSKEFKIRKKMREFQVEATLDGYPLVLGENHIKIEIRDRSGQSITDATVLVNYYMPPMPRMVPMNYKTKARLDDTTFEAKLNIIMAGPWYIKIIVTHREKISTTKFNIDAQ